MFWPIGYQQIKQYHKRMTKYANSFRLQHRSASHPQASVHLSSKNTLMCCIQSYTHISLIASMHLELVVVHMISNDVFLFRQPIDSSEETFSVCTCLLVTISPGCVHQQYLRPQLKQYVFAVTRHFCFVLGRQAGSVIIFLSNFKNTIHLYNLEM